MSQMRSMCNLRGVAHRWLTELLCTDVWAMANGNAVWQPHGSLSPPSYASNAAMLLAVRFNFIRIYSHQHVYKHVAREGYVQPSVPDVLSRVRLHCSVTCPWAQADAAAPRSGCRRDQPSQQAARSTHHSTMPVSRCGGSDGDAK